MVNYVRSRNTLVNDLEGLNIESDCESDRTGGSHGTQAVKEEEEIRAVLITGSFAAYVHFPASPSGREK